MNWTKNDYPIAMNELDEKTREKAIEIANALVKEENMHEGTAIPIAIGKASLWDENGNYKSQ